MQKSVTPLSINMTIRLSLHQSCGASIWGKVAPTPFVKASQLPVSFSLFDLLKNLASLAMKTRI